MFGGLTGDRIVIMVGGCLDRGLGFFERNRTGHRWFANDIGHAEGHDAGDEPSK
jgi:hypothetical protein